ncbi:aromatic acid/H+ symport family MFS transporter [Rhodococcus sp. DMU1]|uniref:MFS transporter n=1 Tax=Rhodococcus sp. DMU1 TaxID=2722825 RepID=UPI00143EE00A|nr:aromatic acid/H+ symport family MFS transporter [Rhodococcus sp. DMU1]QIX52832.1 MFS transporter [Rhodococcus sp. DMU1]
MRTSSDRTAAQAPRHTTRSASLVVALCWVAVLLDGFDLVVLGAVNPALLDYPDWNLDAGGLTVISTAGLVGMTLGALAIGTLTDVLGRRRTLIFSVTAFSVLTLACAFATSPEMLGGLRFLAGLGLGGALPTALAIVAEFMPGKKGSASTTVMTGYHVGAVATALLALVLLESSGWRSMFIAGTLPAFVLVPLMIRYLPESPAYLSVRGRHDESERIAADYGLPPIDVTTVPSDTDRPADVAKTSKPGSPVRTLFSPQLLRTSVSIWVTSFMGLLLVYGLNTWLPTIMREAGYDLGASLSLLLVLNAGAVAGLLVAGRVADRIGARTAGIAWFTLAALFLATLSINLAYGVYVLVFLAGCFVFSSQVLVYAFTSAAYPAEARATALGWSAGVGRIGAICGPILGGALLQAGVAYPWGFYAFAAVGVLGALALSTSRPVR